MEFAAPVYRTPDSVFFWGENRTTVTALAVALALRTGAPLVWLEIRDPSGRKDEYESLLGSRIPPSKRYITRSPEELAPELGASDMAVWKLVRADEPKETVSNLIDFLRLPTPVQELAAEMVPKRGWAVLLVTNADRITPLYPEELESTRAFTDALKRQGVKVVTAFSGPERKDRFVYDHVYRVEGPADAAWNSGLLRREKGAPSEGEGPGGTTPVADALVLQLLRTGTGRA
jgi:hypothetical protein